MNCKRLAVQAALGQGRRAMGMNMLLPNKTAMFASRLGMTNKYAYDYACEDEYFEREMTLLDAKLMHLPIPTTHKHKVAPVDEMQPPHWNDVRFNYFPQNLDRRCYIHDNLAIFYNMQDDYMHGVGF